MDGKRILLGVSGSIAAYKAADLCSQLGKRGAEVHVVLTAHAREFVGIPTFRALTRHSVLTDLFDEPDTARIAHIELAQSADLVFVAPATANVIAKMATGIADDMLTTCLLATPQTTPLAIAPAMNTQMWNHPATQANLRLLESRGVHIIPPGMGLLACQDVGQGKLAEVDTLLETIERLLSPRRSLVGQKLLITAGATREPIDPVRFLTNRSSGKMGYAIAQEAVSRGAEVILISGFATLPPPKGVRLVRVETAEEMLNACKAHFPHADALIAAAAVSDFTPAEVSRTKIKKQEGQSETVLHLKKTTDILATLARNRSPHQIVIGFAAETEELLSNAQKKLIDKGNLDLIVANDVTQPNAGFDTETNIVTLIFADGTQDPLPLLSKQEVSCHLLDAYESLAGRKNPLS